MSTTSTPKTPITSHNALFTFYDIESLNNVFTLATFSPHTNEIEVFYLVDAEGQSLALANTLADPAFDSTAMQQRIAKKNPAWVQTPGKSEITTWNLATYSANERLATIFGLSNADLVNNPRAESDYPQKFRLVCDTDPGYDLLNKHPYLAGYNSANYDTVMLSLYLMEAMDPTKTSNWAPVSATTMRAHNDQLFSNEFRTYMPRYLTKGSVAGTDGWNSPPNKIRNAMMNSGRHIDIARFNEAQQRVAIKRLLGMLGRQILESDKLGGHNASISTMEDFMDLLAYNVSDVVGLEKLFQHSTYANAFDLKKALLDEYPETIYDKKPGAYAPDVQPHRVRRNGRLSPDSTSAKFVALILCPYGNLDDIETVSFDYPSESVARDRGIPQVNVLEASKDFFLESVSDPGARAQFMDIYHYYKRIEGKNFNDSDEYKKVFPKQGEVAFLADVTKVSNNLPYFAADGKPTSCFATFSTGGIHGAEANIDSYQFDLVEYRDAQIAILEAQLAYPVASDLVTEAKRRAALVTLPNGIEINTKDVLLGSTAETVRYRKITKNTAPEIEILSLQSQIHYPDPADLLACLSDHPHILTLPNGRVIDYRKVLSNITVKSAAYRTEPQKKTPELFVQKSDGANKLNTKYTFTSAAQATHEDFTSYYPNMLRNMSAFHNEELGEDRYAKIFFDKERYGDQMKAPGITEDEKTRLSALRNGTKLILNTASGAGDTTFKNSIRMNNKIISMRIIGQLFSWRIGQAQTLVGARIISTNTDGLYSVLDEEINNRVLAEQAAAIHVDIEPEPLLLVSKDSNNRLELELPEDPNRKWETEIISASGGSLSCHEGPHPTKSLAHPAALDFGLAQYLKSIIGEYQPKHRTIPLSLSEPLDQVVGMEILAGVITNDTPVHAAQLFQNVIAASSGSITYPFASDAWVEGDDPEVLKNPRSLQHYNRMFIVKPGTPGAVNIRVAGAYAITAASKLKRANTPTMSATIDDETGVARKILLAQGLTRSEKQVEQGGFTLLPTDKDLALRKLSGIDPLWPVLIINDDLHCFSEERLVELLGNLDLEIYNQMLAESFNGNWMNTVGSASTELTTTPVETTQEKTPEDLVSA